MFFLDALRRVKSSTSPLTVAHGQALSLITIPANGSIVSDLCRKYFLPAAQKFSGMRYHYNDCLRL